MTFEIGVDIGGTFTDVICSREGELSSFKDLTTPEDPVKGLLGALELASVHHEMTLEQLMAQVHLLTFGSTIATNAVVQGRTGKVGLICTKGFRHVLTLREGGKVNPLDFDLDYPEPYVPVYLTLPVTERINAEGGVEIPLNEDDVRKAIIELKKWNVEAIAVCLLWSPVNPSHEIKIGRIIEEMAPGLPYSLSHKVNPAIREYRRTAATSIDASLKPLVTKSLAGLSHSLEKSGFRGQLLQITSSGGRTSTEEILQKPLLFLGGGPNVLPAAATTIARLELGIEDKIMACDMGGTSFEVSLVKQGKVEMSRESQVSGQILGLRRPDVSSIGAGGGSIAWCDKAGGLSVGPQSAAAMPGPACYARGGKEPTVTDANLVRGFLGDSIAAGRVKLDRKLAEEVIQQKVARPLNISLLEAAFSICSISESNMADAILNVTSRRGIDPREYLPVCGGAATGLHIIPICRELKIKRTIVAKLAGVLSPVGALVSDCRADFTVTHYTRSSNFDFEGVAAKLKSLEKEAEEYLTRMGFAPENRRIDFTVEARYPQQIWELEVALRTRRIGTAQQLARLVEDFHATHQQRYYASEPGREVEFLQWSSCAVGVMPRIFWRKQKFEGKDPSAALKTKRLAYFEGAGKPVETPVYDGNTLSYGNIIEGPAIVDEPLTTVVVFPRCKATITQYGNYLIEL